MESRVTLPALRNVPYPGDPIDLDLTEVFSGERGGRVLAHLAERNVPLQFFVVEVREAMRRVHAHCGTGKLTPS